MTILLYLGLQRWRLVSVTKLERALYFLPYWPLTLNLWPLILTTPQTLLQAEGRCIYSPLRADLGFQRLLPLSPCLPAAYWWQTRMRDCLGWWSRLSSTWRGGWGEREIGRKAGGEGWGEGRKRREDWEERREGERDDVSINTVLGQEK